MLNWRARLPRSAGTTEEWARRGFRVLLLAALLVLLLLGLRDIVRPFLGEAQPRGQTVDATASYPRDAAQAFAARFALAYLTFDAAHPEQRRLALEQYIAADSGSADWDGQGKQTAVQALPSGVDARDGAHAVVTVAVLVDGGRWVYLDVPVVADGPRLAVSGTPILLPPPAVAVAAPLADVVDQDPGLSSQLLPYLTAFMRVYAASSQAELAYYAAPGVDLSGLGGQVTLAGIDALSVEQPSGTERSVVAVVGWTDPANGATLTQRYRLRLLQADGKWLVEDVGAAA